MHESTQEPPSEPQADSPEPLTIGLGIGLGLLVILALIRWRKRPLPYDRLPEVARRQRMKGL